MLLAKYDAVAKDFDAIAPDLNAFRKKHGLSRADTVWVAETWLKRYDARSAEEEIKETVLAAIRVSEAGPRFFGLYEGDSVPGRTTEEDLQLARIIARYGTRDEDLIVELMVSSARRRPKWQEKRPGGITFLRHVVRRALAVTESVPAVLERDR